MRADDPNLPYLRHIAEALGELREQVVFVGGAVAIDDAFLPVDQNDARGQQFERRRLDRRASGLRTEQLGDLDRAPDVRRERSNEGQFAVLEGALGPGTEDAQDAVAAGELGQMRAQRIAPAERLEELAGVTRLEVIVRSGIAGGRNRIVEIAIPAAGQHRIEAGIFFIVEADGFRRHRPFGGETCHPRNRVLDRNRCVQAADGGRDRLEHAGPFIGLQYAIIDAPDQRQDIIRCIRDHL